MAVILLAEIATPLGARAAQPEEDPETLIRLGNDIRRKGDDKRAEGYLRRAYELAHTPRSAAQLGLVELALGRFLVAERHLSEALAGDDPWVQDHKETLSASIAKARAKLLGIELVGAPRDATVVSADGTVTKVPVDGVLWLDPGEVKLTVQAIGRKSAPVALSGTAGEKRKLSVVMPSLEQPAAPPAPASPAVEPVATTPPATTPAQAPEVVPDARRTKRVAGLIVAGAGVALAVAGVLVLAKGNSEVDATNASGAAGGSYDPGNGNYKTLQGVGVGLITGGAAAAVAGGILYFLGHGSGEASSVSLNASAGRGLLQWSGAF